MKARSFILLPIAIGSLGFTGNHTEPPRKLEMRLSFPFLHKKFSACKDSSLTARVVIYNRTDTLVSFSRKETAAQLAFEVVTSTTKFTVERKETSHEEGIAILFPGDSLVIHSVLVSSTCQLTTFSRRIPKPKQGLRSIRAVYVATTDENFEDNNYEEKQAAQPLTSPDYKQQRNAVRRTDAGASVVRSSLFKGTLVSNLHSF